MSAQTLTLGGAAIPLRPGGASRDASAGVSPFVREANGDRHLELIVRGAKCAGCLAKIEGSVSKLDGVKIARLNLSTGHMNVVWRGALSGDAVAGAISDLGYSVSAQTTNDAAKDAKKEERRLLAAMGVAGFAAANIMLLSVSVWSGHGEMGEDTRRMLHAASGMIALPAVLWSGRPFFSSAWSVLRKGHANMDVPISLAIILAFTASVIETVRGGPHAYFDACAMLLFFLLIGRFLDMRLRRRAHAAAQDLAALRNRSATRITEDGVANTVRADEISPGDTLLLASGERAAVDMEILEGFSDVDESLVSGESLPRRAGPGAMLYSGSVNLGDALTGRALSAASTSMLADIAQMLEAGEQRRSAYRKFADRAASLYVPFVHTTAFLACIAWLIAGAPVGDALMIAVSTLIITCPCALALAAPVVQMVASGRLFRSGVYLKSGDALERLATADHVVFDKTGTLTLGAPVLKPSIAALSALPDAAKLARASRHPLSRALAAAAGAGDIAQQIKEHPGLGLEGIIDGRACRLGSAGWVGAETRGALGGPSVWFALAGEKPVEFRFEDQLRPNARRVIETLNRRRVDVEILSGDAPASVEAAAKDLGVERWRAGATPQEKSTRLETLRDEGKKVLMVGDGLNDAGALALAHASLAPGGAMDVSQSASDAVYTGEGLDAILTAIDASQRARGAMLQNFALAAAYNLIAVPIAVTGHATPLVAAIAMSASSMAVTLNALRLNVRREATP